MNIPKNLKKYQALKWLFPSNSLAPVGPSHHLHPQALQRSKTNEQTNLTYTAHLPFMVAGTNEGIYCLRVLKRDNAKCDTKPCKYSHSRSWQWYSKLNVNETKKMLNLQEVYQRKEQPKDTMPQGPGVDRETATCHAHSGSRFPKHTRHTSVGRPSLWGKKC